MSSCYYLLDDGAAKLFYVDGILFMEFINNFAVYVIYEQFLNSIKPRKLTGWEVAVMSVLVLDF